MRKLEIGPHEDRSRTPDGQPVHTWHTLDSTYQATYRGKWGAEQLPVDDESYDWVHASHVLEHLPWWQTLDALKEIHRILSPGGRFTVWVPDAVKIIHMAVDDPEEFVNREQEWECGYLNPEQDAWVYMNARVFWGARPGEVGREQHFHRAMFGYDSLSRLMAKAGFSKIRLIGRDEDVDPGHGWMELGVEGTK